MKKQLKTLLLVACFISMALPSWGQASTEGKEFWVALNITTSTGGTDHKPFICITTQHPGGSYTITNPADPTFTPITGLIPPTGYVKIQASTSPGANEINLSKCYPVGEKAPSASCQIKNLGLKVTTTVESSVFVANLMPQSFDAANILPITALQMDYITQDYPGYDHGGTGNDDGGFPEITILATENNTQVTVNPSTNVLNSNGTAPITKTLNAGQVLYLTGENRASLSGTTVTSNKKIAVFTGVNNTDVPGPKSARDHLYEQNMPVDYWGTHFVVTRSMKKDANRIRITAKENGTNIAVDGYDIATINSGDTYEFELCSPEMRTQTPYTSAVAEHRGTEFYFDGEAHYIETSCPCAVFSYDVSETYYISNGTTERDPNAHGDPSMVWISPLEQQLRKVTFGVMNTDKTTAHYVNIITPTNASSTLEVREVAMNLGQVAYGNNMVLPTDVKPVPGNPAYSYARIKLSENKESVYTITSGKGFIAHVYGSGDKESYAYSCGSAAVQQGVNVSGETFTNGYRSDSKFCFNTPLDFDAKVGTDEITSVHWDFGDGTTENYGLPQTTHTYTAPGWYDVTANLIGHQVCTTEENVDLGTIHFSFRVVRPDTVYATPDHQCISADSIYNGNKLTAIEVAELLAHGANDTTQVDCASDVVITPVSFGIDKIVKLDTIVGQDQAVGYNGQTYYASTDVVDSIYPPANNKKCLTVRQYHVKVITCLDINVVNDSVAQHICPLEDMTVGYTKTKGDILSARFVVPGVLDEEVTISNANTLMGSVELPTASIRQPGLYKGQLIIEDMYTDCGPKVFPIDLAVYYPSDIFRYKFNNVLAVYNSGYGGNTGYDFKAYQWYLNYQPIEGANEPVLYLGDGITFTIGDVVYVELTNLSGVTIPSCPQTIYTVPDYTVPDYDNAPARKVIKSQRMYILRDGQVFDIYGQRVQ